MNKKKIRDSVILVVTDVLANLGTTAEEIARNLEKKGIKGKKCDEFDCPLSVYFKLMLTPYSTEDHPIRVIVLKFYIFVEAGKHRWDKDVLVDIDCPEHLTDFVEKFDKGMFPKLVE